MKKFNSILFCAVAAFAVASCNKEAQELPEAKSDLIPMTFTATTTETRTALDEDHVSIKWLTTDKISVFDGVANRMFSSNGEGTSVQFTGEASDATNYLAVYPYNEGTRFFGTLAETTLAADQAPVNGTFADGLNINAATSADKSSFHFENVLSVAKFTLNASNLGGKTIKSVKFASAYPLAGDVNVLISAEEISASAGENTVNEVTLTNENGFADGTYYFVVLPNAGGEISMTFVATDGCTASITATLTKPFSAGKIKNLGTVSDLTWTKKYSIVFGKEMTTNSAQLTSSVRANTVISSGTAYVTTQPFNVVSGSAFYGDGSTSCLRIGASKKAGELSIALSSSGSVTATQIIVNCAQYSSTNDGSLSVNNSTSQAVPSISGDLVFDFNDTEITSISLATTKSTYVYSIDVVYVDNQSGQGGQGEGNYYKLVTNNNDITAGTYVIGALRSTTATDKFYFATTTMSSGDWTVEGTGLTVAANNNERKFDVENLPANAKEFTFTGNNTDGFTILSDSKYLYITNTGSSRKLGFASTGSSQRWKCIGKNSGSPLIAGGIYFSAVLSSGSYTISENSTDTNCLRGYNSATQYRAVYLFKKVTE